MKMQPSTFQQSTFDNASLSCDSYTGRKRLELNRRLTLLHHKRGCLERELRAINNALQSLTKQLE